MVHYGPFRFCKLDIAETLKHRLDMQQLNIHILILYNYHQSTTLRSSKDKATPWYIVLIHFP